MTDPSAQISELDARAALVRSDLHPDSDVLEASPVDGGWYFSQRRDAKPFRYGSPNFVVANNGQVSPLFFHDNLSDVMARLQAEPE